jgi:hypothetical protein
MNVSTSLSAKTHKPLKPPLFKWNNAASFTDVSNFVRHCYASTNVCHCNSILVSYTVQGVLSYSEAYGGCRGRRYDWCEWPRCLKHALRPSEPWEYRFEVHPGDVIPLISTLRKEPGAGFDSHDWANLEVLMLCQRKCGSKLHHCDCVEWYEDVHSVVHWWEDVKFVQSSGWTMCSESSF